MSDKKVTGIVLAGGNNRKMGFEKGLALINKKTSIEYVCSALEKVADEIIIITNNNSFDFLGYPVHHDIVEEHGPLGGLYTGLMYSKTSDNLLLACDMPFVSADLLKYILEESSSYEIGIPLSNGKEHLLCGYYSREIVKHFPMFFRGNIHRLQTAIRLFNFKEIPIDESLSFYSPSLFLNIHSQSDIEHLDKIL